MRSSPDASLAVPSSVNHTKDGEQLTLRQCSPSLGAATSAKGSLIELDADRTLRG